MQGKRRSSRKTAKPQPPVPPPPIVAPPPPPSQKTAKAEKAAIKAQEAISKQQQKQEKQLRKYQNTIKKCDELMTNGKFMRAIPDLKTLVEDGRFMENEVFKGVGCVENWKGLCRGGAQEWYSLAKREGWISTHPLDLLCTCFASLREKWIQLHNIALPFIEDLVRKQPNNYQLRVSYGNILFSNEHHLQAEQQYLEAVRLNPDFEKTHQYLAWLYGYIFDVDKKAIQEADKALAINPNNFYAKYIKAVCLPDKAERLLSSRKLIEERPDYYRTYLEIAKFIEEDGQQKRGYLMKIIDHDPKFIIAYLRLGTMQERLNNRQKAIEYYHTAMKIEPRQKMVNYYMASFYEDQKQLQQAIKHYKIACKDGNCMESYKALGLLYKRQGMNRQAIEEFEHFMALNPYDYDVINSLGLLYDEEDNRDKAEEYFRLGIKLQPQNFESYLNMGAIYQESERYQQAKTFYLQSLRIEPKEADVYYGMAICCGELHQFAQALAWGQKCVSYGGDTDKEVYEYMGDIQLKANNYVESLRWYLRHIELVEQLKSQNTQTPMRSLNPEQVIEVVNSFADSNSLHLELQLALICIQIEQWEMAEIKFERVREICQTNGLEEPEEVDFFFGQGEEWAELRVLGKRSLKERLRLNRMVRQFDEKARALFSL